ncbi:MAG: hypothetical protein HYV07_28510 [Deltaproteobacteria bacterium]|nr:hypothetical protein [Deltaproteobacteria bacterium]
MARRTLNVDIVSAFVLAGCSAEPSIAIESASSVIWVTKASGEQRITAAPLPLRMSLPEGTEFTAVLSDTPLGELGLADGPLEPSEAGGRLDELRDLSGILVLDRAEGMLRPVEELPDSVAALRFSQIVRRGCKTLSESGPAGEGSGVVSTISLRNGDVLAVGQSWAWRIPRAGPGARVPLPITPGITAAFAAPDRYDEVVFVGFDGRVHRAALGPDEPAISTTVTSTIDTRTLGAVRYADGGALADGRLEVLALTVDGRVFRTAEGEREWTLVHTFLGPIEHSRGAVVRLPNGTTFVGRELSGQVIWHPERGTEEIHNSRFEGVTAGARTHDGGLVVGTREGDLYVYARENWYDVLSVFTSAVVTALLDSGDRFYVGDSKGHVTSNEPDSRSCEPVLVGGGQSVRSLVPCGADGGAVLAFTDVLGEAQPIYHVLR